MITVSAQISLYPLGCSDLGPAIGSFIETLEAHGLSCEIGAMSTVVWGDDEIIFSALREAYQRVAELVPAVLQVTLSNACPLPASNSEMQRDRG